MTDRAIRHEGYLVAVTCLVLAIGFVSLQIALRARGEGISVDETALAVPQGGWAPLLIWAGFTAGCLGIHWARRYLHPHGDPYLFPVAAFLSGIGLLLLTRLSPDLALWYPRRAAAYLGMPSRQLGLFLVALVCFLVTTVWLNDRRLQRLSRWRYLLILCALGLTALTLVVGQGARDAPDRRLWLAFGPIRFETVEVVKVLVVLFAASYFVREAPYVSSPALRRWAVPEWRVIGPFLFTVGLAVILVVLQRDLGPAFLLACLAMALLYVGSGSATLAVGGLATVAAAAAGLYVLGVPSIVRSRIDAWLDPFGTNEAMARAIWAVSSGGWGGAGLGFGQPYTLPAVEADFPFVAAAEELGFLGALVLLAAYAALASRGSLIALRSSDLHSKLLAAGVTILFTAQALVIMAGSIGAIPLTGITLPFVSHGGSSMVMSYIQLAILLRISASA